MRHVVGPLQDLEVLGLGTLVEGRPVHVAVAAPGEVGEGSDDTGPARLLEALDVRLLQVVGPQAERLQVDDLGQVAEAELVQERGAHGARHRRDEVLAAGVKVGAADLGIGEVGRAQVGARVVHAVVVEAVADEDPVLLGEVVVDPDRELVGAQLAVRGPGEGAGARVRIRDVPVEVDRLRRQPARGDDVPRERLPGERVVDRVPDAAEVALLHRGRSHGQVDGQRPRLADPFVAHEEERLAREERPAERPPELVPVDLLLLLHEVVGGVEDVVAQELEDPAVELAASRLGGRVQHPARLAELGGVGTLLDLDLLEGVDGGLDVGAALVVVGHVDAVDLERELAAAHAADRGAVDEVRADRHDARSAGEARRSRGQAGELVEAAAVERQVDELSVRHVVAERARLRVEQGRGGGHLRRLRQRSDLQLDVHAHGLADGDLDRVDDGGLEPRHRHRHPVETRVDRRHHVVAAVARGHVHRLAGGRRGHGHVGPGHDGLLRVPDVAHDAARLDLRPRRRGQG